MTGVALIPVLFYTYTGVLGRHLLWADIAVFYLSVLGAFALDFRLLRRGRFTSLWQQILGLLALWGWRSFSSTARSIRRSWGCGRTR